MKYKDVTGLFNKNFRRLFVFLSLEEKAYSSFLLCFFLVSSKIAGQHSASFFERPGFILDVTILDNYMTNWSSNASASLSIRQPFDSLIEHISMIETFQSNISIIYLEYSNE